MLKAACDRPISIRVEADNPWLATSEAPSETGVPERVLLVAQRPECRDALERACLAEGYGPCPVANASALLARPPRDASMIVVVLDDDAQTLELCGELRGLEELRSCPVLVVTPGPPHPNQAAAALLAGADDYCSLLDDFRPELRARLRVHLRNQRLRAAVDRLRGERNHLRQRATTDSLTGALGRRALADCLQKGFVEGQPFAVLFADIDHFKRVNDDFGHAIGDLVLQRVAATLSRGRRAGDACGRYGGEEFVLVVTHVSPEQAGKVAERHREAVARLRFGDVGGPQRVTVSFGVAVFDPLGPDVSVESLLARADAALYQAKRAGRNRVVLAEAEQPHRVAPSGRAAAEGTGSP